MVNESPSPLSIISEIEKEIEEMLKMSRQQAEKTREAAKREASELVRGERERLEEVERQAFESVLTEGKRKIEEIEQEGSRELVSLQKRLEARFSEAVQAVVDVVLGQIRS